MGKSRHGSRKHGARNDDGEGQDRTGLESPVRTRERTPREEPRQGNDNDDANQPVHRARSGTLNVNEF
jgi:hypothetical protein